MKSYVVAAIGVLGFLFGFWDKGPHDSTWGYFHGAEAKVLYKIVDQDNIPVANAIVSVSFQSDYPKLKYWKKRGTTDANGLFEVAGNLNHRISASVEKEGYYRSIDHIELRKTSDEAVIVGNKWQPYGMEKRIVLKKKKKPIEMSGARWLEIAIPAFNEWIGFDFEKCQWMPPFGNGVHLDAQMRFTSEIKQRYLAGIATMEMSFTNSPYAGGYVMKKDEFSEMEHVYHADTNKAYNSSFEFLIDQDFRNGIKDIRNIIGKDEYMVCRIRTSVDEEGKLKSAHYARIDGEWLFGRIMSADGVYFNPTPNDTNLEDMATFRDSERDAKQRREAK